MSTEIVKPELTQTKRETMLNEVKTQNNISVNAADAISFNNTLFVNHVFYGADGFVYHPVQLHNETDVNEIIMFKLSHDFVPLEFVSVPFDFALTAILHNATISVDSYYRKDFMISFENMNVKAYGDDRLSEETTYKLYFRFTQFDYGGVEAQNIDNLMNVLELAKEYKNSFDSQFTGLNWELLNR